MRLCFNENLDTDLAAILAFLEGVGFNDNVRKMAIDVVKIRSILNGIRQDFPHNGGLVNASSLSDMMLNRPFFPVGWENLILIS